MKSSKIYDWGLEHRHPIFMAGLLLFFIVPELFEKILFIEIPFEILYTILIVSSVLLIQSSPSKRFLSYGIVIVMIAFLYIWGNNKGSAAAERAGYIFLFIYFSFITFYLFKDLMRSKKATPSVIIGAFSGYFMIGVIYFFIYAFLDNTYPDTISVDMTEEKGVWDMFYFSFITLTTIGYGDFSPTSALGQKLAILQGLIGQFYLAIVMAILVGKFLSHKEDN
jgi:voltage-gated potassium channel